MVSNLYCQRSEEGFVAACVESKGTILDEHRASADHFFTVGAQTIFAAVSALYASGAPVGLPTVLQRLTDDDIKRLGGIHEVAPICRSGISSSAPYFFGILEEKLALRRAEQMGRWIGESVQNCDDAPAFCSQIAARANELSSPAASENALQAVCDQIDAKVERMQQGKHEAGFITGVAGWDAVFGGVIDANLYALAGRPGLGKTAMMEQIVAAYLAKNHPVSVFEKDMSPQKLVERMVCRALKINFSGYTRGFASRENLILIREMVEEFRKMPLHLYNPAGLTAEKLCAIARRDIRVYGSRCIFLDHIQALKVGKDLREGLTQASLAIRANVTDTGVPHIILAHINREGAKAGRPKPEHIKEFDQLFGDADAMGMLWSEKDPADLEPGEMLPANLYAAKNRDSGVSEEAVFFDGKLMRFVARHV